MTSTINLKRRTFYKSVRHDWKPAYAQGVTYKIGKVQTPAWSPPGQQPPSMCTGSALHAAETVEDAIRWGLSAASHNRNDDLPLRVFSFRGTPFDGRDELYDPAPKYGFTRIKPEREVDVSKYFANVIVNPQQGDQKTKDEIYEYVTKITHRRVAAMKGNLFHEYKKHSNFLFSRNAPTWGGSARTSDIAEMVRVLAKRNFVCSLDRLIPRYGPITLDLKKALQDGGVENVYGYQVSHISHEIVELAKSAYVINHYPENDPAEAQAVAWMTGRPGRRLIVSIPDVEPKTDKFYRVMSLRSKIDRLIKEEYADLDEATIKTFGL